MGIVKRPIKKDYLTSNQFTHKEELNKYYAALERYIDYLEQLSDSVKKKINREELNPYSHKGKWIK